MTIVPLKDIIKGEVEENVQRKDFTVSEMVVVKRYLEPELKKEAEKREKAGRPSSKFDKGRTDKKIAKYVGVSNETLRKAEYIVKATEENPEKFGKILEKLGLIALKYIGNEKDRVIQTVLPHYPSNLWETNAY